MRLDRDAMNLKIATETVALTELAEKGLGPERGENRPVVLVVDDERIVADTIADILQRSGFCATAEYRADTALQFAAVIPPDLVIIDILLPGMNGIDLAVIMEKEYPDCRVLLLTADPATEEMVDKVRREGHNFPVLMKPLYPGDLLFAIADPETASRAKQHCNS